ncbi:hypothetical protein ACWGJ9_11605 [Curtobacterium citreum]
MSNHYLVQRLTHQHESSKSSRSGFDKHFYLEYMGRAEFENGDAGKSLRRIRKTGPVTATVRTLTVGDTTRDVHFVAHPQTADEQWQKFEAWAAGNEHAKPFYVCEYTLFPEQFRGEERSYRTDAWWALDSDTAWALDADTAATLVTAFNTPATA